VMISEVGLGCNRLGETNQPEAHWVRLVEGAADLGVTVFDTAERYSQGRSEAILGQALGKRDDVYIATKVSRSGEGGETDFSAARIVAAVEGSLRRLKRDRIDIYQLHSPSRQDMSRFDWAETMNRLREQGKIRFRAVAINSPADGVWLIEQGLVDVLQITYNIFVTEAQEALFPLAEKQGVGLLGRMPLARGVLSGKFRLDQTTLDQTALEGYRARLDGERATQRIRLVEELRPLGTAYPGGLTRLAHHFGLTPKAMSAIIPGARTLEQLTENVAASNGRGLPAAIRQKIDQICQSWN